MLTINLLSGVWMVEDTYYVVYFNRTNGDPIHYSKSQIRTQTAILLVGLIVIAMAAFFLWPGNTLPFIQTVLLSVIFLVGQLVRVERGKTKAAEYKAKNLTERRAV